MDYGWTKTLWESFQDDSLAIVSTFDRRIVSCCGLSRWWTQATTRHNTESACCHCPVSTIDSSGGTKVIPALWFHNGLTLLFYTCKKKGIRMFWWSNLKNNVSTMFFQPNTKNIVLTLLSTLSNENNFNTVFHFHSLNKNVITSWLSFCHTGTA